MGSASESGGWSAAWPAPAKLNLMLRILGRRPDGYHELQTVFQFIDLADLLAFRVRADGEIRRHGDLPGVPPQQDLSVRAAKLLQTYSRCPVGVDIRIDKRLPMGGGLGGGSSDAATTLVALNVLWGLDLDQEVLAGLGLRLGADVPVFVRGQAAWAEGIGERLRPVELPCPFYLVLAPACQVSTAAVFAAPELTRDSPRITIADFIAGEVSNACLPVVRRSHPTVAEALDWLDRFASGRLTGTGACVFAALDNAGQAYELAQSAAQRRFTAFVARGLNRSPLLDRHPPDRNDTRGDDWH